MRGTSSFGTDARLFDFPQMITTEWEVGSTQDVVWASNGGHKGGYTYRLCKMPAEGKTGLTEECFARNVLKFAGKKTYWRTAWFEHRNDGWQWEEKTDLTVGTYPEGSAWRYQGPIAEDYTERLYKDHVKIPCDLEPGQYVLSWRWDAMTAPQVWVSCANIEII